MLLTLHPSRLTVLNGSKDDVVHCYDTYVGFI